MEFVSGNRLKKEIAMNRQKLDGVELDSDALLVIKLPNSAALRVVSRSLFLAMVILALPSIGPILRGPSISPYDSELMASDSNPIGSDSLPSIPRDLAEQGFLRRGDKALVVSPEIGIWINFSEFFEKNGVYLTIESDLAIHDSYQDGTFDFVLLFDTSAANFPDRVLKVGGILVTQLSDDPSRAFRQPPNYKISYLRRFDSTIVAMRKMGYTNGFLNSPARWQWLCGSVTAAKTAVLEGLEDVLLEPPLPIRAMEKSLGHHNMKKMKFLPDLLGDSLGSYRNRVFITIDDDGDFLPWFHQNYPTRNQYFEVYRLETEIRDKDGISEWLMENVKEEDFVVLKAEARVVGKMIEEKTICLIDELFLECEKSCEEREEARRPYCECLAFYGRLRVEGVAVHQWWP